MPKLPIFLHKFVFALFPGILLGGVLTFMVFNAGEIPISPLTAAIIGTVSVLTLVGLFLMLGLYWPAACPRCNAAAYVRPSGAYPEYRCQSCGHREHTFLFGS
jgi:PHP family Zn ribbon phosphoesterase